MMNRLDGLVEYYQAQTLTLQFLTQHGTHPIGHHHLLRIGLLCDVMKYDS
jgi:hypothetical protein